MEPEHSMKNWLTSAVFEYACKNETLPVIEHILKDKELSVKLRENFAASVTSQYDREKVKPVFLLIHMLRKLLSSIETFTADVSSDSFHWNSEALPKIIKLLEATFEQYRFISVKKFFSLIVHLKFLDLMHLLRLNVESSALMQRLNLHFPRWFSTQKSLLEKQFSIDNPKILDKVEESCAHCRKLILNLAADPDYKSAYIAGEFANDMEKMRTESVILMKEVISNLSSNAGSTIIEKGLAEQHLSSQCDDLGYQLLLDYILPEATPERLLRFLNEMESSLAPPSGGFSSCLLPFDTISECSDDPMDSECDESGTESGSEESSEEKNKTLTKSDEEDI